MNLHIDSKIGNMIVKFDKITKEGRDNKEIAFILGDKVAMYLDIREYRLKCKKYYSHYQEKEVKYYTIAKR